MYSPTMMRWMQQDPAGHVDGPDLYVAERGNPLSSTDAYGLSTTTQPGPNWRVSHNELSGLSATEVHTFTQNSGTFDWKTKWRLKKASALGGMIIQKIDRTLDIFLGNGTDGSGYDEWAIVQRARGHAVPRTEVYWEAWEVEPGQAVTNHPGNWDDWWGQWLTIRSDDGVKIEHRGTTNIEGEAVFWECLRPEHLRDLGWNKTAVMSAGGLLATYDDPGERALFQKGGKPIGLPFYRSLTARWKWDGPTQVTRVPELAKG